MRLKIIGARAANPIASTRVKKHASMRCILDSKILQIDAGNPWQGRADYLVITHLHFDHIGRVDTVPKTTTIYVPHWSFEEYLRGKTRAEIKLIPSKIKIKIGPFGITPIPVSHARNTRAFGYRVEAGGKSFIWQPDFRRLVGCMAFMKNLDAFFFDSACFAKPINTYRKSGRYGHMPVQTTLRVLLRQGLKPKKVFLTHLGKQLTPLDEKLKILRTKFPSFQIDYIVDGQILTI